MTTSGESWVPVPDDSPFPLASLPLGTSAGRAWVAIGDHALDLAASAAEGWFAGTGVPDGCFAEPDLNRFLASGPDVWRRTRGRIGDLLADRGAADRLWPLLTLRGELAMDLPVAVGDFVDFYSSVHHATNLGRMFRPDGEPLLPNWRHLPVGYHGRSGTIVADGASIVRPSGLRLVDGAPQFGPTDALDIELEVGAVVGVGNELGRPIPIDRVGDHVYGLCLVDDWSARDIQAFEYQPLGPFLGKSFATSMSPWLVSLDALEPFRVAPPAQDPPVAGYLRTDRPWAFDLHLEVTLQSAAMRDAGMPAIVVSRAGFADMYWTVAQQLAHLTANGASTRPGDLFASGTVSGPDRGSEGSLIELTWRGERPIALPDGTERAFLLDGDRVTIAGWAGSDPATRIGLGSVTGTIVPAREPTTQRRGGRDAALPPTR